MSNPRQFSSYARNPLNQLVELTTRIEDGEDDKYKLLTELRIHPNEIETDRAVYKVSIKRATLFVDREGMTVVPKSKFGEVIASPIAQRTIERSVSSTKNSEEATSNDLGTNVEISGLPSIKANAAKSRSQKSGNSSIITEKETITLDHPRVKAVGGDAWELTEPNFEKLDKKYLHDDVLCELTASKGANFCAVSTSIIAYQRDITYESNERKSIVRDLIGVRNKDAIIGILIAKSLNSASGSESFSGRIKFSETSHRDEE